MHEIERPAPVLVAAFDHDIDGFTDSVVGLESCVSQVIESTQDVVVPERWEREAEPAFVDHFAGSERAKQATGEEIVFTPPAGPGDRLPYRRRFRRCTFVFVQSFQYANRGMERGASAWRSFAVPAPIFELFIEELPGQGVVRFLEIRADTEDSTVDARLRFTAKVRTVAEPAEDEPLVDTVDHSASLLAGGIEAEVH